MQYLKQSTAVMLKIGPFLDDSDGKTAETGLTITQADVRLSKNGGNLTQKTDASACTHDEIGVYQCPIDTTDSGTLGRLQLWVHEAGALPVWHEYMVVTANFYDSLFSTDHLQVDTVEISGDAAAADNLELDYDGTGYAKANSTIGTCTTNTDLVAHDGKLDTVDGIVDNILLDTAVIGALGAGLTALPWNVAWDAEVQSECADALTAYDPPTRAELTTDKDSIITEVNANETKIDANQADLNTILADTNELQTDWANGGRLDLILDIIAADTTTDIPALIAALNDLSAADVNAQVVDVLKTDTIAEMAQGAPPASPTFEEAVNYVYRFFRNKTETTATEDALYDDAGITKLVKSTISDDNVTFTKGEYGSGA